MNLYYLRNLKIKAKRSNLVLNCESSEAKRTYLFPKLKLAKRSEHVYNKKLKNRKSNGRSEANWSILNLYNIEAKRTGSIVTLYLKPQKSELSFFLNERQETKVIDNELAKFCHY
jgi:hypothetical protein